MSGEHPPRWVDFGGSPKRSSPSNSILIRDIRCLPAVAGDRGRDRKFKNFPRNEPPNFTEYLSEWPEMIFSQREVTEGQNKKGNCRLDDE
jgi:hypothetical protein